MRPAKSFRQVRQIGREFGRNAVGDICCAYSLNVFGAALLRYLQPTPQV